MYRQKAWNPYSNEWVNEKIFNFLFSSLLIWSFFEILVYAVLLIITS